MGLGAAFRMWRHWRGFGVHSPTAFRLLNEVVRSPGRYYAYDRIEREAERSGGYDWLHDAMLLFRLAARGAGEVRFSAYAIDPSAPPMVTKAVRWGESRMRSVAMEKAPDFKGPLLMYALGGNQEEDLLCRHLSVAGHGLLLRHVEPLTVSNVLASLPEGVAFHALDSLLAVNVPKVTVAAYTLKI